MKQAFIYSLKVWLTSVVLGPILYYFLRMVAEPELPASFTGLLIFVRMSFRYGFFFSIPSFILFFIFVPAINKIPENLLTKKLALTVIGVALTILPVYPFSPQWGRWAIMWVIAYGSLIVAGIWFYKLSAPKTGGEEC